MSRNRSVPAVSLVPTIPATAAPVIPTVLDPLYIQVKDGPRPPYRTLEASRDAVRCWLIRHGVSASDAYSRAMIAASDDVDVAKAVHALSVKGAPQFQRIVVAEGRVQDRCRRMGVPIATVHAEGTIVADAQEAGRKAIDALRATLALSGARGFRS